jgi:hypothetical protein
MEPQKAPNDKPHELANDILRGADEIAEFIFGDRTSRRKVYYLAECTKLPIFRLGSVLCARRSVLLRWIAGQDNRVSIRGCYNLFLLLHRCAMSRRLTQEIDLDSGVIVKETYHTDPRSD